jgi:pyruvate/2-oxoglutarate dehydrogenase complex dihydrolipoamide acyltransferase (E2) component
MRRGIAEHMVRSRATIPHGYTVMAADLTPLAAWRERQREAFLQVEGAPLTYTVCFLAALAGALEQLAGSLPLPLPAKEGRTVVDLGVAVAVPQGLLVPVLRNAATRSLGEVARQLQDLAGRARAGQLAPVDMGGAVMSVTNVGSFGNLAAFPLIPVGQVGILGPGSIERRPMPTGDGGIRSGWQCLLSLSYDRSMLDEVQADQLLRRVIDALAGLPEATLAEP